ncbi:hypothetical protein MHYP_G00196030 [Metynnis hypsauchen]
MTSGTGWGWTAPSQSGSLSLRPSLLTGIPLQSNTNNTQIVYCELLLRLDYSHRLIRGENDHLVCNTRLIASFCSKGHWRTLSTGEKTTGTEHLYNLYKHERVNIKATLAARSSGLLGAN